MIQQDILITWMKDHDIPITRERYLNLAYPEGEPDPWTAEDEMMLPKEIQEGAAATGLRAAAEQATQKLATDPTDPEAKRIVAVFNQAISIIDASEPKIRDMIESGMMDIAGVSGTKVRGGVKAVKDLSAQIAHVRQHHIKAAFRHLRKHLPSDE
jgi:hypothetical protein